MTVERSGKHRSRRFVFRRFDMATRLKEVGEAFSWQLRAERPSDPARDVDRQIAWDLEPGVHVIYTEEYATASRTSS
jgi:hypothetical protein